jgi:hypothetical protein
MIVPAADHHVPSHPISAQPHHADRNKHRGEDDEQQPTVIVTLAVGAAAVVPQREIGDRCRDNCAQDIRVNLSSWERWHSAARSHLLPLARGDLGVAKPTSVGGGRLVRHDDLLACVDEAYQLQSVDQL